MLRSLLIIATILTAAFVVGPRACCYVWPVIFALVSLVTSGVALVLALRRNRADLASSATFLVAFALCGIYWNALHMPAAYANDTSIAVIGAIDFIPALFARWLLPDSWGSGFHGFFRDGITYCFPGPPWWEAMRYFRGGVIGYVLTFWLFLAVAKRIRRRSAPVTGP